MSVNEYFEECRNDRFNQFKRGMKKIGGDPTKELKKKKLELQIERLKKQPVQQQQQQPQQPQYQRINDAQRYDTRFMDSSDDDDDDDDDSNEYVVN